MAGAPAIFSLGLGEEEPQATLSMNVDAHTMRTELRKRCLLTRFTLDISLAW